jgi:hypothetical protein
MSTNEVIVKKPTTPTAEEVRRILNQWSSKGFLHIRKLGDRLDLEEIQTLSSYSVRVRTQYETRTVQRTRRPYHGGPVDDHGVPPGPWEIEVRRPEDFEDRTENHPVPHTESVHPCADCGGAGLVNCSFCHGWGKVTCNFCNGRGYRERTEMRSAPGPGGQMQTQTVTVRDNCTCFGGKVNCTSCGGRGKVQCATCTGSGSVVQYDLLTVQFRVSLLTEVLNTTQIPEEQLKQAVGVFLVDDRNERIDQAPAVLPEVDQLTAELLKKSHQESHGETRLLFERLRVQQLGVHEVRYRYGSGNSRRLWIYGAADSVHAPGAPKAWGKLWTVLGSVAAALALAGYLLFTFVLRH